MASRSWKPQLLRYDQGVLELSEIYALNFFFWSIISTHLHKVPNAKMLQFKVTKNTQFLFS